MRRETEGERKRVGRRVEGDRRAGWGRRGSQERHEGGFALVEGLETFRSVRYAVSHRRVARGGCHDFRALIKEIRKREINFCVPVPQPLSRTERPAHGRTHRGKRDGSSLLLLT